MATAEEQAERPSLRAEPRQSLKQRMLAQPRGKPVPVDMSRFPDWPQDIYVRPPAGRDIATWEQSGIEYGRKGRAKIKVSRTRKAELIQMTVCDEGGKLAFEKGDINDVAGFDAGIVNHLFSAARKVAGQDLDEDEDDDDEDEEGN